MKRFCSRGKIALLGLPVPGRLFLLQSRMDGRKAC